MYKKMVVLLCISSCTVLPVSLLEQARNIYTTLVGSSDWAQELHYATQINNYSWLKKILIGHYDSLSAKNISEAFWIACDMGRQEIVQLMLKCCDMSISSDYKGAGLRAAVAGGKEKIVELLLQCCSSEISMSTKGDAFWRAARGGHLKELKLLLKYCGDEITAEYKARAFMDAAIFGYKDIIGLLLQCCAHELSKETKLDAFDKVLREGNYDLAGLLFSAAGENDIREILPKISDNLDEIQNAWLARKLGNASISQQVIHKRLSRGDAVRASILCEHGCTIDRKPVEHLVEAMIMGLEESREIHRFKAIIHLMDNAGISLPDNLRVYLNNPVVDTASENFTALYSYLHELAEFYLLNAASYDVAGQPHNELIAYYNIFGRAFEMLDNDYMLEVLLLNGIVPDSLEHDEIVYRGMRGSFNERYIEALFDLGHKAYVRGEARLFGFSTRASGSYWEYSGTYVSSSPQFSANFAVHGTTSKGGNTSLLMEIRLLAGSPKLCGINLHEWELIVNAIKPSEIKAIYVLGGGLRVTKAYINPYYIMRPGEAPITYKVGDFITPQSSQTGIERYEQLQCLRHQRAHFSPEELAQAHQQMAQRFIGERKLVGDTCRRLNLFENYTICNAEHSSLFKDIAFHA